MCNILVCWPLKTGKQDRKEPKMVWLALKIKCHKRYGLYTSFENFQTGVNLLFIVFML